MSDYLYKKWTISDILLLVNTKGIGDHAIRSILTSCDSLYTFKHSSNTKLTKYQSKVVGEQLFDSPLSSIIETQLHILERYKINIIGFWDNHYPSMLSHDNYAPPILYSIGDISFINPTECISIVGTRRNSSYGKMVTETFVKGFTEAGVSIISGMAQGIDTIAHKACIDNNGKTVAVLASGLDQIQPSYAKDFARKIVDSGGGVLSAYPPGTKALNQFFVQRNRIVSGISKATVVIESKSKGGSLWTAKFATEQHRDVYAVPGKIYSDRSQGTHSLIKNNLAIIALSPEQILEDLGIGTTVSPKEDLDKYNALSTLERTIMEHLDADPKPIDIILEELSSVVSVTIAELQSQMLMMEFNGLVKQSSGNAYYKIK